MSGVDSSHDLPGTWKQQQDEAAAKLQELANRVEADLIDKHEGQPYEGLASWRAWAREAFEAGSDFKVMLDHLVGIMASQPQDLEAAVILLSFRGVRLASRHESAQQRAARLLQQQAAGDPTGNIKSTAAAYAELGGALRAALQGGAGAQELDLIKQRAVDLLGQLPHATDAADEQCWPSGGNALQLQAGTAREHVIEMVLNISCVRGFCAAGEPGLHGVCLSPALDMGEDFALLREGLRLQFYAAVECRALRAEVQNGRLVCAGGQPLLLASGPDAIYVLGQLQQRAEWRALLGQGAPVRPGLLPFLEPQGGLPPEFLAIPPARMAKASDVSLLPFVDASIAIYEHVYAFAPDAIHPALRELTPAQAASWLRVRAQGAFIDGGVGSDSEAAAEVLEQLGIACSDAAWSAKWGADLTLAETILARWTYVARLAFLSITGGFFIGHVDVRVVRADLCERVPIPREVRGEIAERCPALAHQRRVLAELWERALLRELGLPLDVPRTCTVDMLTGAVGAVGGEEEPPESSASSGWVTESGDAEGWVTESGAGEGSQP